MKDLRNHGSSPHAEVMDYTSMASDVLHFCRTHNLSNVSLLGHSMYGHTMHLHIISNSHLNTGVVKLQWRWL
jgi:pimeloyl-ACP methyl ester carboxylesterase